jgi:hypothetical protein
LPAGIAFKHNSMSHIISYYFTSSADPQGREPVKKSDVNYIIKWYWSIIKHELKPVLFHDGLTQTFIDFFPQIKFMQVPPVPEGMQLHDYHWVVSHNYLLRHDEIENVFFTDCPDCEVINNPFTQPGYNDQELYCGDEAEPIGKSAWMNCALRNPELLKLENFNEIFTSENPLYNAGVLGGHRSKVIEFTGLISELIDRLAFRPNDGTGDMALYNYILHRNFKPVHGFPVNSVFKGYEDRQDVWFKHK